MTNNERTEAMNDTELELISRYGDQEAVEDGMLVELERTHRATRPLWEYLVEHLPADGQPPDRWPVALLQWFGSSGTDAHRDLRAKAALIGLLGTHGTEARRVDAENTGGGIFNNFQSTLTMTATIVAPRVPLSEAARAAVAADPGLMGAVLTGGDDYELLFTCAPDDTPAVAALARELDLPLSAIGQVAEGDGGVRIIDSEGRDMVLGDTGYRHF